MKIQKTLFFVISFFLFLNPVTTWAKEPVKIRVAILAGVSNVSISISGSFEIIDTHTKELLYQGKNLSTSKVAVVKEGLKIRHMTFNTKAVTIISKKKAAVTVNNRRYRGEISIFGDEDEKLSIVNALDLESYIKGVLYHEISHKWPLDALKAQAVAVRTYAMYQKQVMSSKDYDLMADTSSQVYGGYSSEKRRTNRAVNFTHGEILTYQGKLFPAYFHATCAGMTEDASELWNIKVEPLKGGRLCSFCSDSPHYYWKATLDLKTIQKKLGQKYKSKGKLKNVAVSERNARGRVRTLELKDEEGESFIISAKEFRLALGPDVVRSTNFSIVLDQDRLTFSGKGWGHGVGLCQWGAYGMSKKGYDYKQILQFYYPGSEIIKI